MALDYETQLNNLKAAQQRSAVAGLENTRNQALSNLQAEQNQNRATYNAQRSSANAQNRLSARNFQEYLASTGRANSGLGAQARMQSANNLNTSLNALNAGEAAALADINRRTTDAQNAYNTGLAGANADIEAKYIQNLLDQRDKELSRQLQQKAAELQERQFQESIRQFNENLALQKQQLQQRFSSGSGGGGRSYRSGSSKRSSSSGTSNAVNNVQNAVYNAGKSIANTMAKGSSASSSLTNTLNKAAKAGKWSYKDTGKSTQRGIYANGAFYINNGSKWIRA
jgi:hypothetical protein